MSPFTLKLGNMRLTKSCHDEIQAFDSKWSHFMNSTSTASISASEVMLILGKLRLIFVHFDIRVISKADLIHFMTFSETASDDLKMALEVKSQESKYFLPQKESKALECNRLCHSSCKDIILAWKFTQVYLHWIIKNIASFRYEALEAM